MESGTSRGRRVSLLFLVLLVAAVFGVGLGEAYVRVSVPAVDESLVGQQGLLGESMGESLPMVHGGASGRLRSPIPSPRPPASYDHRAALEGDAEETAQDDELDPEVVRELLRRAADAESGAEESDDRAQPLRGLVQAVDQPRRLIVVNLGRNERVQLNDVMTIRNSDSEYLAEVAITHAYESASIARIVVGTQLGPVSIGDVVHRETISPSVRAIVDPDQGTTRLIRDSNESVLAIVSFPPGVEFEEGVRYNVFGADGMMIAIFESVSDATPQELAGEETWIGGRLEIFGATPQRDYRVSRWAKLPPISEYDAD